MSEAGVTFADCLNEAADNQELVAEWDRLTGYRLRAVGRRSPIERMVDTATGFEDARMKEIAKDFIGFIVRCVWMPLAYSKEKS